MIAVVLLLNTVMVLQSMEQVQYTPETYKFCDDFVDTGTEPPCICPAVPNEWTDTVTYWSLIFCSVEWTFRVFFFEPADLPPTYVERARKWLRYLFGIESVMDFLATFPSFMTTGNETRGYGNSAKILPTYASWRSGVEKNC